MNLHNDFLNEWRNDAVMGDDLFDEARRIPILHSKWMEKYLKIQLINRISIRNSYKKSIHQTIFEKIIMACK